MDEKQNWLTIDLTYFKESGKYYSDIMDILLPNNCSFYERRNFLSDYIEKELPKGYLYVSLDSHVLGFPFMKKFL